MAKNGNLNAAGRAKKDEFYTQLSDIEKEMRYYRKHFDGKTVFCNCDDPFESNFFKYFVLNFNKLNLKKLIATCYTGSPIAGKQLSLFDVIGEEEDKQNKAYKAIVTTVHDADGNGGIDMLDVAELFKKGENELTELKEDGDFRSSECLKLMEEADIVVTNPPFSLFRQYVNTLIKYKKKFIIIGNVNAITYKDFFPLIKDNKVWIGASIHSGDRKFYVPDDYPLNAAGCGVDANGRRFIKVKGVRWYTNSYLKTRHEDLILVKRYSPASYPRYENYNAIEVDSTTSIPCDYPGEMGVPITFLDKYNPDQFEIIGYSRDVAIPIKQIAKQGDNYQQGGNAFYLREGPHELRRLYGRIVIRNLHPEAPMEE